MLQKVRLDFRNHFLSV